MDIEAEPGAPVVVVTANGSKDGWSERCGLRKGERE